MGANPSPCRCPILAQPGRGPTTAKSPSVDDWTCDFQGVRVKLPPQPVRESLAQRQTRKASHSRKNGVNLNRYELAGCGSSTFDTTDSRPGLSLLSCVRKPDVRELRRSARSTPQPFKDMFVFGRSAETCRLREGQRIKQIVRLRISSCEARQLEDVLLSSGLTNVKSDDDR